MELLMKNIHMCRQAKQAGTQITLEEDMNVPDVSPDVEMIIQSRGQVTLEHTRTESGKLYVDGFLSVGILYLDDTKERQVHRLDTKLPFDEVISMEGLEPGDGVRIRQDTEDLSVALINSRKLAIRTILSFSASVEEIYDISAAVETQTSIELCERRKKLELMQLTVQKKDILRLKEEVQLPSNKPDIGEILWDSIEFLGSRTTLREGSLSVQGKLSLFVLYRAADENQSIQWVEQVLPYEGEIPCEGCAPGMIPDIDITLTQAQTEPREDGDGEMRLFQIEGVLDLEIRVCKTEEVKILEDVYSPEKNLELMTTRESYESLVMKNESKCRAGGKIRIQGAKPRILQICHCSGSIKVDNTRIVEDGIRIEGAVLVSILYISSDDTMPFAVLEGTVPFSHHAEVPGIDGSCRFSLAAGMEQLLATMADSEEIEIKSSISLNLFVAKNGMQQCIHEIRETDYDMEQLEAVPGITGYIVGEGESLWDIGKQYYLTPGQIMEMNGLDSENVKKGDRLILMKSVTKSLSGKFS